MGSENSSQETKTRAVCLAEQIGRWAITMGLWFCLILLFVLYQMKWEDSALLFIFTVCVETTYCVISWKPNWWILCCVIWNLSMKCVLQKLS